MLVMDRVDMEEVPERCAILLVVEDDEPYGLLLLHRSRQKLYRLRISFGLASLEDQGHRVQGTGLGAGLWSLQETAILVQRLFQGIPRHKREAGAGEDDGVVDMARI